MAGTEGSSGEEKAGHIWSLLPGFDPSVDDPREYADKIRFLHSICPVKDRSMLAPRLALLMKGTAWAQVKALDGEKLSDPNGGIKLLLSAVADWEDSAELQTYEKFERALYKVTQKTDESVFSYVNRMNVAFAEIKNVTIQEIKAFIMLRQSGLNGEDKKRVLAMCAGELKAKKVEDSMRQLAPRILVGASGSEPKKKVYPVNFVDDEEEMTIPTYFTEDDNQIDDEMGLQVLMEQGDEDALMITEFEDQLIEACQDNVDLSMCFSAYTEARGRVRDKIRARGFWPPSKGKGKNKGSKKGPWNAKGGFRRRQSLADRIANSHCRLCGARGHWRQECPNKGTTSNAAAPSAEIHMSTLVGENVSEVDSEVLERLPISLEQMLPEWWPVVQEKATIQNDVNETMLLTDPGMSSTGNFEDSQAGAGNKPTKFCRYSETRIRVNEEFVFAALSLQELKQQLRRGLGGLTLGKRVRHEDPHEPMFFVDHGSVAILDTGASKSVIGKKRLEQLLVNLPKEYARQISWQKSDTVFRFGNNGTLKSLGAVFLPFGKRWLKLEVVDGTTPFLLSNAFCKAVSADICTSKRELCMFHGRVSVPLTVSEKGLFLVDLLDVMKHAGSAEVQNETWEVVTHMLEFSNVNGHGNNLTTTNTDTNQPSTEMTRQTCPAALRVSSSAEISQANHLLHGAQEGDPNICGGVGTGQSPDLSRRCNVDQHLIGQRCQDRQAAGCDHIEAVGRSGLGRRQACRQDICPGPGHRCELRGVHETKGRLHFSLGSQLSQLCVGHRSDGDDHAGGKPAASADASDDQEDPRGVGTAGSDSHRLGCDRRPEQLPPLGSSRGNPIHGKWIGTGKTRSATSRGPSEDAGGPCEGEPRSSDPDPDADSHSATRVGFPDASRGIMNDTSEKLSYENQPSFELHTSMDTPINDFFAKELANLVEKIEFQMQELANHSADIRTRHLAPRTHNSKERLDILEIYCYPNSHLTQIASQMGLKTRRFTIQDGDLRTPEGQNKLWQILETQQPTHIWASPDCKFWGNFSRRNMGRSKQLRTYILDGRKHERPNLSLCEELFMYQVEHGRHFHLEQPVGSEMVVQPELEQLRWGTLPTVFDMCEVGRLNWKGESMRKRTIVLTTSRNLHRALDCRYCRKKHEHKQIAGQVKHLGRWMPLSAFAAKYSSDFARAVVRAVQIDPQERPLVFDELLISEQGQEVDEVLVGEALKRRRLISKQTVGERTQEDKDLDVNRRMDFEKRIKTLFGDLDKLAPRVGSIVLGPETAVFKQAQGFCTFRLVHAEVCRGTERLRIPKASTPLEDLVFRKTFSLRRSSGNIEQVGEEEEWQKLPQRQRIRKGIPSKITLTLFGTKQPETSGREPRKDDMMIEPVGEKRKIEDVPEQETYVGKRSRMGMGDTDLMEDDPEKKGDPQTSGEELEIPGRPPRNLSRHGPGYLNLDREKQKWIQQVHHRLGHPDADTFVRFLRSTNAESELTDAARDYQCDACSESRKGFDLSKVGGIHENLGFNDTIGMDGAVWTNAQGTQFHFTHIIDEGTLFHVARPCGSDSSAQWNLLEDHWFSWAGPPKTIYVDPAKEYLSEAWMTRIQELGITLKVSARESHWQLGRVEAHGSILKGMLTRMDLEVPILEEESFKRAIVQACHAKNSLTRKSGYSPEQAVLGCATRLPGSVTSDDSALSHERALDEGPNKFKEALDLRESARRAFISLDNSNSLRRIMLRRSRPVRENFEVGDLVLYWKRKGGNMRRERGQWFGPARVALVESRKVIWLVHAHRLVRASPQQLRAASLREWKMIKDTEEFRVPAPDWARRIGHQDLCELDPDDLPEPSEPDVERPDPGETPGEPEDVLVPEPEEEVSAPTRKPSMNVEVDGTDVPVPEDDELFGDTIFFQEVGQGRCWEIDVTPACEIESAGGTPDALILAAVSERKKRTEIKLKELSQEDQKRFAVAKHKELGAWLQHKTIRRVSQGKIPDNAIMRCRWLYVWKTASGDELPTDLSSEGKKAKARLIVIGWEDPDLDQVINDAPTLSKDGRTVLLQAVASHQWPLISFDVSTAFLHGKGDGRPLGLVPVPEMREALNMSETDQVQLDGGAYGRIDAPFLWFCEFRDELKRQGCRQSPLDPCVFTYHSQDGLEGCLGIHVDDGIGGGSPKFMDMLRRVEKKFKFGAFEEGEFTYTGIHFRQWDDGSIEYDQVPYIEKIQPIALGKGRKEDPESLISEGERTAFRSLIGALQYAAVHSRPDLAAKVGELQSEVTRAQVKHLVLGNKVLTEAKQNRVSLMVLPIQPERVTYCAFSDASFSCTKHTTAQQGTIIFATTPELLENKRSVVAPVAWYSKKIPRVVRSTLGAEAAALSNSVDRLLWLRILWATILDPDCDWKNPEVLLKSQNQAGLVTDCKSAYDLLTRTALPQCSEHRTTIECLLIRERLRDNATVRWVCSQAMLADCLTKTMDSSALRECLRTGKYILRDENHTLKERLTARERLKWIKQHGSTTTRSSEEAMLTEQIGKSMHEEDFWKMGPKGELIRVHVKPRYQLFSPVGVVDCPVDLRKLEVFRDTYQQGCAGERSYWVGTCAHRKTSFPWTGETVFYKIKE